MLTTMPTVSIIMPAYNAEATIGESIQSVLAQTYTQWELVVVDDCSTDNTVQIVSDYSKRYPNIRLLQQPHNAGVSAARNRGIDNSVGDYLAFLDSDDLWHPDKLAKQLATPADLSYTATAYLRQDGLHSPYVLPAQTTITRRDLLRQNAMSCSSVMVKRTLLAEHRFTQTNKPIHEDYVLWLTLLNHCVAHGINEPLLIYRLSATSKSAGRITSARMTYHAYRAVGYNWVVSFVLTLRYAVGSITKRRQI